MNRLKILTKYRYLNVPAILVLSLTAAFDGCAAHKDASNISATKARVLRDSAYANAWACRNVKKASLYYDTLFTSSYLIKQDYWVAGQVAAELAQYSKAIAIWSKMRKVKNDDEYDYSDDLPDMINPGYNYYEGLIHTRGFKKLWSHYKKKYPLLHRLSPEDSALTKKLSSMYKEDQKVRRNYFDTPTAKNDNLWTQCDKANEKCVDSIIVNRGIITTREFGYLPSRDFCILFDHLPDSLLEKYMPMIETAFKKGGIAKMLYALIKDRSLVFAKKEQIYGTQFHPDTVTKKNIFFPIRKIARVDKRRDKMGLGKLKYYASDHKVLLPKDYKP